MTDAKPKPPTKRTPAKAKASPTGAVDKVTLYVKVDQDVHAGLLFIANYSGLKMPELVNLMLRNGLGLEKPVDPQDLLDAGLFAAKRQRDKEESPSDHRGQPEQPIPSIEGS